MSTHNVCNTILNLREINNRKKQKCICEIINYYHDIVNKTDHWNLYIICKNEDKLDILNKK